jgi:DNA (cytosine-5)-methyltransferase 1
MPPLHIFSFFSGSGFLDLGFEESGYIVDSVNEFSPSFTNAYCYAREKMGIPKPRFGYTKNINDFLTTKGSRLLRKNIKTIHSEGGLVGFIGGPPCPDFSVAGKQKGRDGDNGKLSQSYIDLIFRQKPDFFLFENVKGLWRTSKHRQYFEELKTKISKYYLLTNRLCNALEYGAPQDRDRILLFGIRKGVAKQLGLTIGDFNWESHILYNINDIKSMNWPGTDPFINEGTRLCPDGICKEVTAEYWFKKNDVENHPNANDFFTPRAGILRMQSVEEGDDSKKSYKRIHRWRYSPTVCYGNNEVHLHPYKERRLSAAEALALQSLPKEFCLPKEMSLSDKFKTIGNGVPFLLAQGIALTINDFFEKSNR